MNKKELLDHLAQKTGFKKTDIQSVIDSLTDTIKAEVTAGNEITIFNFGKFYLKEKAARNGVNPKTGAKIQIAASQTLAFKATKEKKD